MNSFTTFDLFRYQITPISQAVQLDLLEATEETIQKKNIYFAEALKNVEFQSAGKRLIKELVDAQDDFYVLKLGRTKHVKIYRPDFALDHVLSHPPTQIYILTILLPFK